MTLCKVSLLPFLYMKKCVRVQWHTTFLVPITLLCLTWKRSCHHMPIHVTFVGSSKVECAKTNTPPTTNTYKRLPIANTLRPWTVPCSGRVSAPTEWRLCVSLVLAPHSGPPLPPCSLSNGLHAILDWFKMGPGWLVDAYSSHSTIKAKEVGPQRTNISFSIMQGGWFPGCKVMVLQANRVGSWRWACGFVYHYYLDNDVVWV